MKKLLGILVLALTGTVMAQSPVLLKDINTKPTPDPSSNPYPETSHWSHNYQMYYKFAKMGPVFFFEANNGTSGAELFKALPGPGSATLVKDINPGTASGYIYYLTTAGTKVFFEADDGTHGDEPWVSDGTAAGTVMLSNYSGSSNGDMFYPCAVGNYCYYCTRSASGGYDLIKSDGTVAGTTVLKNFTNY